MRKEGHAQNAIAANLEVHPSTISRELGRNQGQRGYRPRQAQQKSQQRRHEAAKATKRAPPLLRQIEEKLRHQWSPEQISGWLGRTGGVSLSHEWIYQYARGQIRNRVSIEQRPAVVDKKSRIGDWEIDLVGGANSTAPWSLW